MKGSRLGFTVVLALSVGLKAGIAQELTSTDSLTVLRVTFEYLTQHNHSHAQGPNRAACLRTGGSQDGADPPAPVVSSIRNDTLVIVARSRCHIPIPTPESPGRRRLLLTETGDLAIELTAGPLTIAGGGSVFVNAGFYEDATSGGGYNCEARHEDGAWRIIRCEIRWLS